MKKALYLIIHLAVASLAGVAAAATVELMPDIGAMTGQGYNSAGRLAGDGITGDDVKNWLGSRADGWYTTTGNGDMRWVQSAFCAVRRKEFAAQGAATDQRG